MMTPENALKKLLQQRISAALTDAAVLMRETSEQLLARLDFMSLQPKVIVDIYDGAELLAQRYPGSQVVTMDPVSSLSLSQHTVDLLVANLVLPWCAEPEKLLRVWQSLLRADGVFICASLGPDTLHELQGQSFIMPHFIDMHDVGDMLMHAGFKDPVLDVERMTMTYRDRAQLLSELQVTGMIMGDMSQVALQKNADDVYSVTYEVIFGHAFGSDSAGGYGADEEGIVRIPVTHLSRKK